jgi:hypothetical protein
MMLAEILLPKLSEWRPSGAGRHSWAHSAAGWSIHLAVDKADSLSCLVWELALSRDGTAPAGLTLASWARDVVDRVSGLMEPLKIYEVDTTRDVAILRSESPTRKGDARTYYEVVLHGLTRAVVRRYSGSSTPGREQIAFALTHEVVTKLAGDIAG